MSRIDNVVYLRAPKCFQQCLNPEKPAISFKVMVPFIFILTLKHQMIPHGVRKEVGET